MGGYYELGTLLGPKNSLPTLALYAKLSFGLSFDSQKKIQYVLKNSSLNVLTKYLASYLQL